MRDPAFIMSNYLQLLFVFIVAIGVNYVGCNQDWDLGDYCYDTGCTPEKAHHFHNGYRTWPDREIYQSLITSPSNDDGVACELFRWPSQQEASKYMITKFWVKSLDHHKNGGCVEMLAGGSGSKHVLLNFDSQPGKNYTFMVVIYGK